MKSTQQGEAEDLHKLAHDTAKATGNSFVNPGTPENPLVGMEDRKTGHISGKADEVLRGHTLPTD